jgi:hypothetical protein
MDRAGASDSATALGGYIHYPIIQGCRALTDSSGPLLLLVTGSLSHEYKGAEVVSFAPIRFRILQRVMSQLQELFNREVHTTTRP